jgi:hypothetical protein
MRGAIAYDDPDDDKTPVPGEDEDEARTIVMERRAIAAAAPRVPSSSPPAAEDQRLTLFDPHCVPSRWRRVAAWLRHAGRSLARLLQPVIALPMLPPLPPPKRSPTLVCANTASLEEVFHLLWRLDHEEVCAVGRVAHHVLAARALGPEPMTDAHVLFVLSRLWPDTDGTVMLERLRDRMSRLPRVVLDEALLRLEAREEIALLPADQNDLRGEGAALRHPTRGMLSRCAIRGAE